MRDSAAPPPSMKLRRHARERLRRLGSSPRGIRPLLDFLRGRHPGLTSAQFRLCRRHNLHPNRALEYDLERFRPEDFFPNSIKRSPSDFDPATAAWCDDKIVFALFMREVGGNHPEVVAEHAGGRLILQGDAPDFAALLARHAELVVKPRGAQSGRGVRLLRAGDPDPHCIRASSRARWCGSTPTRPQSFPGRPTRSGC